MAELAGCGWLLKLAGAKLPKFKQAGIILHNGVWAHEAWKIPVWVVKAKVSRVKARFLKGLQYGPFPSHISWSNSCHNLWNGASSLKIRQSFYLKHRQIEIPPPSLQRRSLIRYSSHPWMVLFPSLNGTVPILEGDIFDRSQRGLFLYDSWFLLFPRHCSNIWWVLYPQLPSFRGL